MHIHSSVYGHFSFLYIFITVVIYNLLSILFIISVFITLIICCLHYVYTSVLEAPNTKKKSLCV